jgi:hypothetical protein
MYHALSCTFLCLDVIGKGCIFKNLSLQLEIEICESYTISPLETRNNKGKIHKRKLYVY